VGKKKRRGQFPERCPWFTFSPAVLADFLTGDNSMLCIPAEPNKFETK
jgi:hypothetical protein